MNLCQGIIVAFVWIFILGEAFIVARYFLPLIYNQNRIYFLLLSFLISLFFTLFCYSYWKTTFTSPGSPSQFINQYHHNIQQIKQRSKQEQDIKHGIHSGQHPNLKTEFDEIEALQKIGYCFKCQKIKPIRTHHCKTCGKCVLRMDHHCPWIGNCVGKYNHKYFLLFLLYGSLLVLIVSSAVFADYLKQRPLAYQLTENQLYVLYFGVFSIAALGTAVIFLLGAQIHMLTMNITTIQSFVKGMSIQQPFRKPSFVQNMEEIMGDSVWFLPSPPFKTIDPLQSPI